MSLSWRPSPTVPFAGLQLRGEGAFVGLVRGPESPLQAPQGGHSLLYLFGSDPAARGGGHLLLAPGMKAVGSWSASSELLLVTVQGLSVPPSCADGRWRLDASVQALACEMRRGLLLEERPPLPYFGYLARAMFVAAVAAAERRPSIRAPRLPRPKLDRVLREIEERLREPLSVEQLASVAGLSRARFAVAFSATIGLSPHGLRTRPTARGCPARP